MSYLDRKRRKETLTLLIVFLLVLGASALAVYWIASRSPNGPQLSQQPNTEAQSTSSENFLDRVFGVPEGEARIHEVNWGEEILRITLRLLLAALLGTALAYRPRKRLLILKRNPYVAQTQILLAVVASALMIIVGDNAARAFGIFAAVSVVRFRTNIRDPKEITVLLISLAVGLGTGVGRWDLAVVLTIFALLVLWILEYREVKQVSRAMELKVATRNVAATQSTLREVLKRHGSDAELRGINRESSDEPLGSITYSVDISPIVTTDDLSEEILALDSQNVDSIEWEQKKSFSYIYQ